MNEYVVLNLPFILWNETVFYIFLLLFSYNLLLIQIIIQYINLLLFIYIYTLHFLKREC